MEERFYHCNACGNLAFIALASGITPHCCGKEMTLLKPNTSDGNSEKHLPAVECVKEGMIKVKVGTAPHPMTKEHNIRLICLETDTEFIIHYLEETQKPEVCICFTGKPKAVYSYCNIHGLWRTDIPSSCSTKKPASDNAACPTDAASQSTDKHPGSSCKSQNYCG